MPYNTSAYSKPSSPPHRSILIIMCSVKGAGSEEEGEDTSSKHDAAGDERVKEWAKLHNNESLQIVCGYHLLPIPNRGGEVIFQPSEHLQSIKYCRPDVSSLGLNYNYLSCSMEVNEVNAQLAAAEEALALSMWTVATICRVLSLETVMTLISGVLLEKQVVVICPNLGVLSAITLSIIPMIRPFQWQSLLLPVEAAGDFLNVMRRYMESLCSNLRAHSITNVQSNNDKVSLLLKDSFIDSFPSRDQPFIKVLLVLLNANMVPRVGFLSQRRLNLEKDLCPSFGQKRQTHHWNLALAYGVGCE